ncbi:MAG TPA: hemolysin family protein [Anaerolineales bacterium]|nr:hemolysin family protein [Anaerolineales bacterium]
MEILVILLLILANGVFAMAEIAVVSARKARLQEDVDEGRAGAAAALRLAEAPNDFLSTVQIGITLIGILAGAFGGATIAEGLETYLDGFPRLAPYSEFFAVAVVVVFITYFSLVLGELAPKRLALRDPERIAARVAGPMGVLARVGAPVVRLLSFSTDAVIRFLGVSPSEEPEVTEEEIRVMIEQGTRIGVFDEAEQDMIEGVLKLGDRRVGAVMTPRSQVVSLALDDDRKTIARKLADNRYSRFPLVEDDLDSVVGIVQTKDILLELLESGELDLRTQSHEPLYVPERLPALRLLAQFREKGAHTALVVDEYGVIQGIVTHNDILEDIVGFAPTLGPFAEPELVERADGSYLADGLIPVDEIRSLLRLGELPGEAEGHFHTLGGFVTAHMGKIPSAGEGFAWGGWAFEVMDMDLNRVDKVLIRAVPGMIFPD